MCKSQRSTKCSDNAAEGRDAITGLVSVVIPCFNVANDISECLRSVSEQTYPWLDVVVVDDGSTDNTLGVLEDFRRQYGMEFRVLTQSNSGAPSARNLGLEHARGTYVQFLDADDKLCAEKIARQVEVVSQAEARPDLVVGAFLKESLNGGYTHRRVGDMSVWSGLVTHRMGFTSSNLFRKASVVSIGGWDEALPCSQEYDLMFRLVADGAVVECDHEPLTIKRERALSVGKSRQAFTVSMALRREIVDFVRKHRLVSKKEEQTMLDHLFNWIRTHYAHNPAEALEVYDSLIPRTYIPKATGYTTAPYVFLYRLLGFRKTESVRSFLKRVRVATS